MASTTLSILQTKLAEKNIVSKKSTNKNIKNENKKSNFNLNEMKNSTKVQKIIMTCKIFFCEKK